MPEPSIIVTGRSPHQGAWLARAAACKCSARRARVVLLGSGFRSPEVKVISILLVDDHARLRRSVRGLVEASGLARVVGEAPDLATGLEQALRLLPDLVVADLHLPDGAGLSLIAPLARLSRPIPVFLLSMHGGPLYLERAKAAGAAGFLSKWDAGEALVPAIVSAHSGRQYFNLPDERSGRGRVGT